MSLKYQLAQVIFTIGIYTIYHRILQVILFIIKQKSQYRLIFNSLQNWKKNKKLELGKNNKKYNQTLYINIKKNYDRCTVKLHKTVYVSILNELIIFARVSERGSQKAVTV